jgi:hypothetical protein
MKAYRLNLIRVGILLFALFLLSAATVSPALAVDKPAINVSVIWRPATQLTTIDYDSDNVWDDVDSDTDWYGPDDDDFRYVEAEIYVTTSAPFWAVDLTCKVDPTVLVGYTDFDTSGSPVEDHDDQAMLTWGDEWYDRGGPSEAGTSGVYNAVTGEMDLTATLTGDWHEPLGFYGYTDTFLLATLRYKTASLTTSDDTTITCSGRFLDRDGNDVAKPKFAKGTSLKVLTGYTLNGTITYQAYSKIPTGRPPAASCVWDLGGPDETVQGAYADSKGVWTVTTRTRGHYDCFFIGLIPSPGATGDEVVHLISRESAELSWDQYSEWYTDFYFLPVELKAGNLDVTQSPETWCYTEAFGGMQGQDVAALDLGVVTSSYEIDALGDVNGDGATDEEDLAIVGGNYGYCEDDYLNHFIYDLPRDYDDYVNSRIWLGGLRPQAFDVTLLVPEPKEGRDLWATLSPDGSRVAFIRSAYDKKSGTDRYGLYVSPLDKPKATSILPKGFTYDAFAPSWSPDGQRIAFVCSWDAGSGSTGYQYNEGYLCLIDANGSNFQLLGGGVGTHIWPPSWDGSHVLVFAYGEPGISDLYRYFLDGDKVDPFEDVTIPGNPTDDISLGADMPIISGDQLFYRYDDGIGVRVLRWARLNCSSSGYPCFVDPYFAPPGPWAGYPHTDVTYDDGGGLYLPISSNVDYYEIDPDGGSSIILYEMGGYTFRIHWVKAWNISGSYTWPEWEDLAGAPVAWLTGQVGNPSCSSTPCDLYALRNTVDWAQRP